MDLEVHLTAMKKMDSTGRLPTILAVLSAASTVVAIGGCNMKHEVEPDLALKLEPAKVCRGAADCGGNQCLREQLVSTAAKPEAKCAPRHSGTCYDVIEGGSADGTAVCISD